MEIARGSPLGTGRPIPVAVAESRLRILVFLEGRMAINLGSGAELA